MNRKAAKVQKKALKEFWKSQITPDRYQLKRKKDFKQQNNKNLYIIFMQSYMIKCMFLNYSMHINRDTWTRTICTILEHLRGSLKLWKALCLFAFAFWNSTGPKAVMNSEIIHYLCCHQTPQYVNFI